MSKRKNPLFKVEFEMSKKGMNDMATKGIGHSRLKDAVKKLKQTKNKK